MYVKLLQIMINSFLQCTDNFVCISFSLVFFEHSSQSKVRYFWVHVGIKQNVAGFKISMNYSKPGILMEIEKASSNPIDNVETLMPVK